MGWKNINPTVTKPEPRAWVYWIIQCVSDAEHGGPDRITYVRHIDNRTWNRNGLYAKKFPRLEWAMKVAKYLTKRQKHIYGRLDWGGCKIEVVKIIVERKHALEWPLTVLDKLAKA